MMFVAHETSTSAILDALNARPKKKTDDQHFLGANEWLTYPLGKNPKLEIIRKDHQSDVALQEHRISVNKNSGCRR